MKIDTAPILLDCLFHTDETAQLEELEQDFSYEDCRVKPVYIFQICALGEIKDNGKKYTKIFTPGDDFITVVPIEKVLDMISAKMLVNN